MTVTERVAEYMRLERQIERGDLSLSTARAAYENETKIPEREMLAVIAVLQWQADNK